MFVAKLLTSTRVVCVRLSNAYMVAHRTWLCSGGVIVRATDLLFTGRGSSPSWTPLLSGFARATYIRVPLSLTKQYNLLPAKGV